MCLLYKNPKILQVARLLISKGIDIQQKDKYGKTAVDYMNERSADKVPDKLQILDLLQSSEWENRKWKLAAGIDLAYLLTKCLTVNLANKNNFILSKHEINIH